MEKIMSGRLISASAVESADILYASGFNAPDEFIYFEAGSRKYLVVSILEYARACREARKDVHVITRNSILKAAGPLATSNFLATLSAVYGITEWTVPDRFPTGHADTLRSAGIQVHCVKGEFFPERARKTPEEIEHIRASMKATEEAMYQVETMLRESVVRTDGSLEWHGTALTGNFLRAEVEAEFKRKSFSAVGTILCCGPDSAMPHNIGTGPILAGQPLVADIFPRSDRTGYWGDMTRTFVKGTAAPIVRKAFEAVKQASEIALKHMRAGVPGILLHQLAAKTMEEAGFPTGHDENGMPRGFIHGLGHGVGLEIHENPRVAPSNPNALEPGNVVSVEPGLYDARWGGIRLEDLVLVTASGYENFCSMPKELEVP